MWEGEIVHGFVFAKPLVEEAPQCRTQNRISWPVETECYPLKIFEAMKCGRQFSGDFLVHILGLVDFGRELIQH